MIPEMLNYLDNQYSVSKIDKNGKPEIDNANKVKWCLQDMKTGNAYYPVYKNGNYISTIITIKDASPVIKTVLATEINDSFIIKKDFSEHGLQKLIEKLICGIPI